MLLAITMTDVLDFLVLPDEFYAKSLRGGFATALLSLTAVLFAVQNFLLTGLYRDVYSKARYRGYARRLEPNKNPLDRLRLLSRRMRACTTACLIAAVLQFTLGFVGTRWASLVCIASVVVAMWFFVSLYRTQGRVVDSWMAFLVWDADMEDEELERQAEAREQGERVLENV